jgi:hypothetical protein
MMKARLGSMLGLVVLTGMLSASFLVAADGPQTLTGKVSDAMCGAKHAMGGGDAECTRACVTKGSKYALVVGTKVYTLDTSDKAALADLNKLAGANAKVTGNVKGDTVEVKSVAPGA